MLQHRLFGDIDGGDAIKRNDRSADRAERQLAACDAARSQLLFANGFRLKMLPGYGAVGQMLRSDRFRLYGGSGYAFRCKMLRRQAALRDMGRFHRLLSQMLG